MFILNVRCFQDNQKILGAMKNSIEVSFVKFQSYKRNSIMHVLHNKYVSIKNDIAAVRISYDNKHILNTRAW
jgi:hypothetical protein